MPINEQTDAVIMYLNELVAIDREAIQALVGARVPCSIDLARHPTVQVGAMEGVFVVGPLGVLNGFFGVIGSGPRCGWGAIAAVFDQGELIRFERTDNVPDVAAGDVAPPC